MDREERSGGDDHEIEIGVCDEDAVGGFDYLGENVLDGVERAVFIVEEDGAGTFLPVNLGGCMHSCFDVGAVKV